MYLKVSLESIYYKPGNCVDFQWTIDSPITFTSLAWQSSYCFQYFASSIKNMKNIHSLLIHQIDYIFPFL